MNRILATTAIAAAFMAPAFAEPPAEDMNKAPQVESETDLYVDTPAIDANADADVEADIEYGPGITDQHEWVDTTVIDANMKEVGEVERVELDEAGEVTAIVVETGGILEVGGREIMVSADEYMTVSDDDSDDTKIQLTLTASAFAEMPDFDEDKVSDYPLSNDDVFDGDDDENTAIN